MKLRIEDSSVRFRLSEKDLKELYKKGKIKGSCQFGSSSIFKYSIKTSKDHNEEVMCITLKKNHIVVEINKNDVKEWYKTDLVGFDSEMDNGGDDGLYVLIEKDFPCLPHK